MTATLTREQLGRSPANGHRATAGPAASGRRNRTRIALGLVVIVLCVLATATLYASADDRVSVVSVRREVPAGHEVVASDLGTVRVSADSGLHILAASERMSAVGRIATVTLLPGTLLAPEQVSDGPKVPVGSAIAGATVAPGQFPVSLQPGDEVLLVETSPPAATGDAATPIERGHATVLDIAESDDGAGNLAMSLVVPAAGATDVASAGAAGRLSLVVVAAR